MNTSIGFPRPTRRLLLAAAASAILLRPACADALSDGRFRAEMAAVLRAMLPGAEILPDPDPKQILFGGSTIALTNLYPGVAPLAGEARGRLIEAHLATALKAVNAPQSRVSRRCARSCVCSFCRAKSCARCRTSPHGPSPRPWSWPTSSMGRTGCAT